jgi:hypothetical protein
MKIIQNIIIGAMLIGSVYLLTLSMEKYWDFELDKIEVEYEFELDKINAQTDLVESIAKILSQVEHKDNSGLDAESKVITDLMKSLRKEHYDE